MSGTHTTDRTTVHHHVFGQVLFAMRGSGAAEEQRALAAWTATCELTGLDDLDPVASSAAIAAELAAGELTWQHGGLRSDVDSVYASIAFGVAVGYLEAHTGTIPADQNIRKGLAR